MADELHKARVVGADVRSFANRKPRVEIAFGLYLIVLALGVLLLASVFRSSTDSGWEELGRESEADTLERETEEVKRKYPEQ